MATNPIIGRMDRKIIIETYTTTKQDSGERTPTWETFATVWAAVESAGGDKAEEDEKLTAIEDKQFIIRYMDGVLPKMRINFDDNYYTIRSVFKSGRKQFIIIDSDARITGSDGTALTVDTTTITVDSDTISADQTIY